MTDPYQLMPDQTPEEFAALKADIAQHGILVPVEVDDAGNILDGHHRVRAWKELRAEGIQLGDYPRLVRPGMTEEQKRNHVRSLNMLRRHLSKDQLVELMRQMRADGAGYQEIADAAGVSYTTAYFATVGTNELINNHKLPGRDGKARPTFLGDGWLGRRPATASGSWGAYGRPDCNYQDRYYASVRRGGGA